MFIGWQKELPRIKFQLAIALPGQNQLIGSCGIRKKQSGSHQAELGYEIAPLYWGQGYATEAAQKMLNFGFEHLNLHRVWASCLVENKASARVLEKLGMQQEGRIRQNRWMKNRYWDTFIYGILKREWAELADRNF
jgi:RimJ/RimL family protein N-acetyltransferase